MSDHAISGVVISFNEERNIAACIKSLSKVCDEIIIIDSFSSDRTPVICKSSGVTFIQNKWLGYSKTKNLGISACKNDWILSLDADETLDLDAVNSINEVKKSLNTNNVYSFNRKNYYGKTWIKYCGWYPDTKVRLFHKSTATWQGDFVHETLEIAPTIVAVTLVGNILHKTIRNQEHHLQTVNKYAQLAAQKAIAKNKKITLIKSVFSYISHFLKIFVVKKGFYHGVLGFRIAKMSAYSKWLRYIYYRKSTS